MIEFGVIFLAFIVGFLIGIGIGIIKEFILGQSTDMDKYQAYRYFQEMAEDVNEAMNTIENE